MGNKHGSSPAAIDPYTAGGKQPPHMQMYGTASLMASAALAGKNLGTAAHSMTPETRHELQERVAAVPSNNTFDTTRRATDVNATVDAAPRIASGLHQRRRAEMVDPTARRRMEERAALQRTGLTATVSKGGGSFVHGEGRYRPRPNSFRPTGVAVTAGVASPFATEPMGDVPRDDPDHRNRGKYARMRDNGGYLAKGEFAPIVANAARYVAGGQSFDGDARFDVGTVANRMRGSVLFRPGDYNRHTGNYRPYSRHVAKRNYDRSQGVNHPYNTLKNTRHWSLR